MCLVGLLGGLAELTHVKTMEQGPVNGSYCYFVNSFTLKRCSFYGPLFSRVHPLGTSPAWPVCGPPIATVNTAEVSLIFLWKTDNCLTRSQQFLTLVINPSVLLTKLEPGHSWQYLEVPEPLVYCMVQGSWVVQVSLDVRGHVPAGLERAGPGRNTPASRPAGSVWYPLPGSQILL